FFRQIDSYDIMFILLSLTAPMLRDEVASLANTKKCLKILDIATGTGKQAFAFAKKGHDVIGIDLSEEMLKVAMKRNKFENAKFEVADATNLPFERDRFDVCSVSFALHDMIPTVREHALEEMVRVTKPNGTIIIVDYDLPKKGLMRLFIYNFVRLYETYYTEFIGFDIETTLKRLGIEVRERRSIIFGAGRILKGVNTKKER
ncbi:MAG: class I SAM-dependent methyltransferase, partial [Candidatus Bathyarchaeota archaeon]|nr:class I SAM-dependent methyltransferase [Candidatus Bathyarchaeota archaeon]